MKQRQKVALEKITGKPWDHWSPEAVRAYFAFTDRGQRIEVSPGVQEELNELLFCHNYHAVTVAYWKQDFKAGLLLLDDFIADNSPDSYLRHAFEVYRSVFDYIPTKYQEWTDRLGVSRA